MSVSHCDPGYKFVLPIQYPVDQWAKQWVLYSIYIHLPRSTPPDIKSLIFLHLRKYLLHHLAKYLHWNLFDGTLWFPLSRDRDFGPKDNLLPINWVSTVTPDEQENKLWWYGSKYEELMVYNKGRNEVFTTDDWIYELVSEDQQL